MTEMTRKKLTTQQIGLIIGLFAGGVLAINLFGRAMLRPPYAPDGGNAFAAPASAPDLIGMLDLRQRDALAAPGAPAQGAQPIAVTAGVEAQAQQADRLIIRSGAITLVVDDTRAANQALVQLVSEMAGEGAFVVSSSERGATGDNPPQISVTIRVPSARFTEVMDRLAAMAVEVVDRTESGQDVTEEFVDVQAKVESLEAARDRLLEIVRTAGTTEELLLAESQLTEREKEIDSLKARLQYLEQSARLSSISIELRPSILNQPVAPGWRPSETVRAAVERLAQRFQNFVDRLIVFAIADLPWWIGFGLVALVVFLLVRRWWRRQNSRQPAPASTPE
jgi:hypothetical protein